MKDEKDIRFYVNAKMHADFKIRLDYEGISQPKFFRLMMSKLLEKDPKMLSILASWRKDKNKTTLRREQQMADDIKQKEEFDKEFGMTDEEIRTLYDLFDE